MVFTADSPLEASLSQQELASLLSKYGLGHYVIFVSDWACEHYESYLRAAPFESDPASLYFLDIDDPEARAIACLNLADHVVLFLPPAVIEPPGDSHHPLIDIAITAMALDRTIFSNHYSRLGELVASRLKL